MAEKTVIGGLWIPYPPFKGNAQPGFSNMLIDASTEIAGGVIRAPKDGDIAKVGFQTGTVTTGATVDVRLETVSLTDGDPTGTLLGTNSNASQVIGDGDDNTWFTTALTTAPTVTKGDLLAVVIANASTGNMNIRRSNGESPTGFPYSDLFTTAWAKSALTPNFALEYSDGSYASFPGSYAMSAISTRTFNSSDTPDERGLIFQMPFPFRLTGFWFYADIDEALDIVLYDSDGSTALETLSLDKDVRFSNANRIHLLSFAGTQSLSKDTNYRLVFKPTTTTDGKTLDFDVNAAAIMDSFGGGQKFHHTERTDAGSWTETTTRRPFMGILCDGFDDATGGSASGARNPLGGPI